VVSLDIHHTSLIKEAGFQVESFTAQQAELAREAYARYGKGRQTAGLNYGDCFSYALAKATGLPLLFKGQDFSKTDILPVEIKN
jgi:ribonuclease VapC